MQLIRNITMAVGFAAAAVLALQALPAQAQSNAYPSRPITLVVPYAAGGTADVLARVLAERASVHLGQPIVIDNRSGGDGIIGAQIVARAKPDGYTLLQVSTAHVILPSLRQDLAYQWRRDFVPVMGATNVPQALAVNGKSSIRSIADLVAAAKSSTRGIDYSSGGAGSISHLTSAYAMRKLGLHGTHVPFRGLSNAVQAVLGDQVQFTVVNIPDVIELTRSGALRLLAVSSEQRVPYLPEVPTFAEQGFDGWTSSSWSAYVAPANTPGAIVERVQKAYLEAAREPAVQERLGKLGIAVRPMAGPELGLFMTQESDRWRRVVDDNRIKLDP